MKITDVKAVYPRWKHLRSGAWQSHFWQIVVRIESDDGVVGLGYGGGGNPGTAVVNEHLRELLLGRSIDSVDDIRNTWDLLYFKSLPYGRTGIPIMALSGIDLALWDLLGKAQNEPVYELLGGLEKSKVRAYASAADFERDRDCGYTAVKFSTLWTGRDSDYDKTVEIAAKAREIFGPEALVMTDCYMTWDSIVSREMARLLREYDLYWFEDVMTPDELDEMAILRTDVKPIFLAGGEHEFTQYGFASVLRADALDIWQPDITWCGGITAGLRIMDLAKDNGVKVVPHRGGEIWGLHFIAATECDDLAETHPDRWIGSRDELWLDEPVAVDGYITLPDRPGFGVILNEEML